MHIIMFPRYVAFLVKLMARTKADLRSARNAMAAERNNRSRSRDGPRDGGARGAGGGAASASGAADGRDIDGVAAAEVMPAAELTAAVAATAFGGPIPQTPAPPGACCTRWLRLGPDGRRGRRGRGKRDAVAAALDSVAHYDGAVGGEDGERMTLVPLVPREKRVRTHRQTTTTTREDEDEWQGIKTPRSTRTGTFRRTKRYTTTTTTITVVTVVESDTDNDSETL